ncbi:GNAT family N-acetyltransferase [Streptomyces sp. NPDC092296]|uniref:GNAT family N-acetyltransferase n=1 Tax=Streptomyces sp. NPDC092296 TaxID=3366012 RepID=UPI0037F7B961
MSYRVRRVSADEWLALRELRLAALRDTPTAFVTQYADERLTPDDEWQARALHASGAAALPDGRRTATLVLEAAESGRWCGMVSAFQEPEAVKPQVHLVGVYVAPADRGRGAGAAEALVRAALEWAWDEGGAERVRLFVREDNQRALSFYRRLGFAESGVTMQYPPDLSFTEYEMEYLAH